MVSIGVLGVQGDVAENVAAAGAGAGAGNGGGGADTAVAVATAAGIDRIDGLVIPGGESTVIGKMALAGGLLNKVKERALAGMPVLGVCAGMVLLSKSARDRVVGATSQPLLGLLDVAVERNSFGRQRDSFEADLSMEACGIPKIRGVFIRSPAIIEAGAGVVELARLGGRIVAARQGNVVGTSFHPELGGGSAAALYGHFADIVRQAAEA